MKNMLETLQDVLLVFTIVLLVYVLYKRLLVVLGKNKTAVVYPTIGEKVHWKDSKHAAIEVTLKEVTNLSLSIFNASNEKLRDVLQQEYGIGLHSLDVDCSSLAPGRYYFKLVSSKMESSQYFEIA